MNYWKPDRQSTLPLHRQIEQHIRYKIISGEWPIGTRLPSQRQLATVFEVNRSTITIALDELKSWGIVEGNKGGGTTVINNTWNLIAAASQQTIDWQAYVNAGTHQPNLKTIQKINHAEFAQGMIRTGTGELGKELMPHRQISSILQQAPSELFLGYEEPKGNFELRQQIAHYVKQWGIHCSPDSILIVSGSIQALQLIAVGLLARPSSIVAESPSYIRSIQVFQSAGIPIHSVSLDKEGIDLKDLHATVAQYQSGLLYTIPTFHNPTGILMSKQRRNDLIEQCKELRLPIIEDDVYRELWLDDLPPAPLKSQDSNGNIVYLGSMSKMMSPGLRVGWVIAPEPVIERLADIKMQTDYGSSNLSQYVATQWFAQGYHEPHIQWVRGQLRTRRDQMLELLQQHFSDIADWQIPTGGFYIWVKLTVTVSMQLLFERAIQANILINPGYLYEDEATSHIRLSYAYTSPEHLHTSIIQLKKYIISLCR
ncbi:aminotransferase-like domain-containing protein [Paenibacillus kyungheensis]